MKKNVKLDNLNKSINLLTLKAPAEDSLENAICLSHLLYTFD